MAVAPGVHISTIATVPAVGLRTGVPLFLGVIRLGNLEDHNDRAGPKRQFAIRTLSNEHKVYLVKPSESKREPSQAVRPTGTFQSSDPASSMRSFYLSAKPPEHPPGELKETMIASRKVQPRGTQSPLVTDEMSTEINEKLPMTPDGFTLWPPFQAMYGNLSEYGYLTNAVQGFFANNGRLCYVQLVAYDESHSTIERALKLGLETVEPYDDFDLVCVPDLMWHEHYTGESVSIDIHQLQSAIVRHCQKTGDRMAILDTVKLKDNCASAQEIEREVMTHRTLLTGTNAALYFPWLRVQRGPAASDGYVPPCGHVAGIYARSDINTGVHKAPANEIVEGVLELEREVGQSEQAPLNEVGVNCIRAFPGRGVRVWGARTLSNNPAWRYVNVRRIFLTAGRWIARNMSHVVFEPQTPELWGEIVRDLTAYFSDLFEQGALAGNSVQEAFYVKCDAETNPPELRELGQIITEIGLSPTSPAEVIQIRIIYGPTGIQITEPN